MAGQRCYPNRLVNRKPIGSGGSPLWKLLCRGTIFLGRRLGPVPINMTTSHPSLNRVGPRWRYTWSNTRRKKKKGGRRGRRPPKSHERGNPSLEGAEQSRKAKRPAEKVRRTKTRPGGRPAQPGQDGGAHAHTHWTRAWRPPTRKGRCRRPHEIAQVHRPSPPSNDRRYEKPETSVTGSTHGDHRRARSPRPTPEGTARDNAIAGPRTGVTRSEPSAPPSAEASGRHNEPGSRPASTCPAQPSSKAGGASPRAGERHHGVRKTNRSIGIDRTGRRAGHHAGPRGTPGRHAAGHNQGTQTGAKQQRPPGAANPESAHNTQRTTAREQVPSNTRRRPDRRVRARQRTQPLPATEQPLSGWTSARPVGTQLPASTKQPQSGWTSVRPAAPPRTRNTRHNTPSEHTGEQNQKGQDIVRATKHTERADR